MGAHWRNALLASVPSDYALSVLMRLTLPAACAWFLNSRHFRYNIIDSKCSGTLVGQKDRSRCEARPLKPCSVCRSSLI
jgi:hypothetical protein